MYITSYDHYLIGIVNLIRNLLFLFTWLSITRGSTQLPTTLDFSLTN